MMDGREDGGASSVCAAGLVVLAALNGDAEV